MNSREAGGREVIRLVASGCRRIRGGWLALRPLLPSIHPCGGHDCAVRQLALHRGFFAGGVSVNFARIGIGGVGAGWHGGGMERHTWRQRSEEGLRFYRAQHHAGKWTFWSQWKDDEEWTFIDAPDESLWRTLRELLWRKYQRRRCPWEMIEQIDKLLEKRV